MNLSASGCVRCHRLVQLQRTTHQWEQTLCCLQPIAEAEQLDRQLIQKTSSRHPNSALALATYTNTNNYTLAVLI